MPYTNSTQVELALAQAIVSSNPSNLSTPGKLVNLGTTVSSNTIPPDEFNYYISQADALINAALSQQYEVPLIEKCDFEMRMVNEIGEYSSIIVVENLSNLSIGDNLIVTDGVNQERMIVATIEDSVSFTVDMMPTNSYATSARLLRVRFPDPIPFISARLTAASIYDKHLKAQTDPGKSDYGDVLRKKAMNDLNNIREGRTILTAQRAGWRFANANLISRYSLKGAIEQDSSRSEPNE